MLGPTITGYYYASCYYQKHKTQKTIAEYKDFCLPYFLVKALTGLPDKILQTPLGQSFVHPSSVTQNESLDFRGIPGKEAFLRRLLLQEIIETVRQDRAEMAAFRRIRLVPDDLTWESVLSNPLRDPELLWAFPAEACFRSEEQEKACTEKCIEIPRQQR